MDIKTGVIKTALEQEASFFYKTEIFAEGKIWKGIINKEETESGYRHPEQHLEKNLYRPLEGKDPRVLHTVVCVRMPLPETLHTTSLLELC